MTDKHTSGQCDFCGVSLRNVILQCDKYNRERSMFIELLQKLKINWDLQSSQATYDFLFYF